MHLVNISSRRQKRINTFWTISKKSGHCNYLFSVYLTTKLPCFNLGSKEPNNSFSHLCDILLPNFCNDFLSIIRNHQQKTFVFNLSAQIGHPPAIMWETKGLMKAFLPSKKPLQNLIFLSNYLIV